MAERRNSVRAPLTLALLWAVSAALGIGTALVLLVSVSPWHAVRHQLAQVALWQCWTAVLVCLALLILSRRRHAEQEQPWAQGRLLVWVLGGLLSAIVLNYGVLPQWLAQPTALGLRAQSVVLMLLQGSCALASVRHLLHYRRQVE